VLGANLSRGIRVRWNEQCGVRLIMQELEAGDSGIRSLRSVQGARMYPIFSFGSEDQEAEVSSGDGSGQGHRLLWPDGT
jgi:hypothetical protein